MFYTSVSFAYTTVSIAYSSLSIAFTPVPPIGVYSSSSLLLIHFVVCLLLVVGPFPCLLLVAVALVHLLHLSLPITPLTLLFPLPLSSVTHVSTCTRVSVVYPIVSIAFKQRVGLQLIVECLLLTIACSLQKEGSIKQYAFLYKL